jgi:peptidylprolyl isomerase
MHRLTAPLAVMAILLTGCITDETVGDPDLTKITFAPALGVDLDASTRLLGGVYVRDITVGTGALADLGKSITVYYDGWLSDGTKFDERHPPSPGLEFPLGLAQVIQGWERGIPGMKVGGVRQIIVPPSLGYGQVGNGSIPGGAVLVFRVEHIGVR